MISGQILLHYLQKPITSIPDDLGYPWCHFRDGCLLFPPEAHVLIPDDVRGRGAITLRHRRWLEKHKWLWQWLPILPHVSHATHFSISPPRRRDDEGKRGKLWPQCLRCSDRLHPATGTHYRQPFPWVDICTHTGQDIPPTRFLDTHTHKHTHSGRFAQLLFIKQFCGQ